MKRIEKTVFISYRRDDSTWALLLYNWLRSHGYDVFIDYEGLASGAFADVILENIRARAHFLVLLTPTALDRCDQPGDWLRREIEEAMSSRRNVIPVLLDGFDFRDGATRAGLTGTLAALSDYNGLTTSVATFEEAMNRLDTRFLNVELDAITHPPSVRAMQLALQQQVAADVAISGRRQETSMGNLMPPGPSSDGSVSRPDVELNDLRDRQRRTDTIETSDRGLEDESTLVAHYAIDPGIGQASLTLICKGTRHHFSTKDFPIAVGRGRTSDFQVDDPGVSREHLRIDALAGTLLLSDLSVNGTFIRFPGDGQVVNLRRSSRELIGTGEIGFCGRPGDAGVTIMQFEVTVAARPDAPDDPGTGPRGLS